MWSVTNDEKALRRVDFHDWYTWFWCDYNPLAK